MGQLLKKLRVFVELECSLRCDRNPPLLVHTLRSEVPFYCCLAVYDDASKIFFTIFLFASGVKQLIKK